jgi:signal transduction histidine kinase
VPPSDDSRDTFETLVASLAHDLRNPMTAIKTFASVIAAGSAEPDSTGELGALASEACDRLEGYLQALQQYGGFSAPRPESVDVADLLRRVVAERDETGRASVDVPKTLDVRCDPFQLRFVLENLVAEALAEAGEKGAVSIGVEPAASAGSASGGPAGAGGANAPVIVLRVPASRGAAAKLRRLVTAEPRPDSWRVVLARAVAARNGCGVDVEGTADGITLRCRLGGGESGGGGTQQSRQ